MQPCEVEATFSERGEPRPVRVLWEGALLSILDTGRRWADDDGQHLLARVEDGRVLELVYNGVNWRGALRSQPPDYA